MPSRNRVKVYLPESYYHIYNRGINKRVLFKDKQDYAVFLNLLKRYLGKEVQKDNSGREYDTLFGKVELLTFCLMPNHYHLLIYQNDLAGITSLTRRLVTSYSQYFNKKYKRTGPLFEDRFKASRISEDKYLMHISRYIHLNPDRYKTWEFSSLPYYLEKKDASWVIPGRITGLFESPGDYEKFLADYKGYKKELDELKYELANSL